MGTGWFLHLEQLTEISNYKWHIEQAKERLISIHIGSPNQNH